VIAAHDVGAGHAVAEGQDRHRHRQPSSRRSGGDRGQADRGPAPARVAQCGLS
jgi:hypothetical protein